MLGFHWRRPALIGLLLALASGSSIVRAAPQIYGDRVYPHWFTGPSNEELFWYRVEDKGGQQRFMLVDPERGTRAPAFDSARVSAQLAKLLGKPVDALPVNSLTYDADGNHVVLHGGTADFRLDLQTYEITQAPPTPGDENYLKAGKSPHPSRNTGADTSVDFFNRLTRPVDLFWINPSGDYLPYGQIAPGGEHLQQTFAGHVWAVKGTSGDLIAVYEATEAPAAAMIGEPNDYRETPRAADADPSDTPDANSPSPDGKWRVLVHQNNLVLQNVAVGTEEALAKNGSPGQSYSADGGPEVYWSPDSLHFVAMLRTPGSQRRITLVQSSPKDQLQPKVVTIPYPKPGDDVPYGKPHLFDVQAVKEIPVSDAMFANPWSIDHVRWRPDGREFTFEFNQRGHQFYRILGVDADTGTVRPIVDEKSATFICYSSKYFARYLDDTGEIIWMSERDGWNHLYLYDAQTGTLKNQITKGPWVVRKVDHVDAKNRQIWFHASGMNSGEDPYFFQYYRINFDGSGLTALTDGNGDHTVQCSPDRKYLIDTWSRVDQPPITDLRRTDSGKLICRLEEADASELTASGCQLPIPLVAKGRDGSTDIYGVIYRPAHFDANAKYPVLEDIYAGPQDSYVPKSFETSYYNQDLADRGFVIVQIDGMGTSNRSKAFHDVCWKNLGDAGFPDRIPWIKAAAAKYPWMDLTRVGIFGVSAGGQNAMRALLDHGDFYQAAVADSGCHDNRMDKIWWNEQWMGWPVDQSYVRSSNVVDAPKLQGKLLLMVGEMDDNVDPASTMQVVNALIKADKQFELLIMPNMGHAVSGTPYGNRRLVDFFVRTFLNEPTIKTNSSHD